MQRRKRKYAEGDLRLFRRSSALLMMLRGGGVLPPSARVTDTCRGYIYVNVVNRETDATETVCVDTRGLDNNQLSDQLDFHVGRAWRNSAEIEWQALVQRAFTNMYNTLNQMA